MDARKLAAELEREMEYDQPPGLQDMQAAELLSGAARRCGGLLVDGGMTLQLPGGGRLAWGEGRRFQVTLPPGWAPDQPAAERLPVPVQPERWLAAGRLLALHELAGELQRCFQASPDPRVQALGPELARLAAEAGRLAAGLQAEE
jgi:hypothetical protein